jgi:protein involved in ribonucleotide reduction
VSTHDTTTARVYGSEVVGIINSNDFAVTGDAAKHKYHRNNLERLELTGADSDIAAMAAVTASSYNNGFTSHMIPRTDKQYAWITGSLI